MEQKRLLADCQQYSRRSGPQGTEEVIPASGKWRWNDFEEARSAIHGRNVDNDRTLKLTGCAKRITRDELPHASKELGESTVEECHADNDIGNGNVACLRVVKREDERRRRKSKQASTEMDECHRRRQDSRPRKRTGEQGCRPGTGAGGFHASRCQT